MMPKTITPFGPASGATVPAEYRPLYRYLQDRYADVVVLSFTQIESLIGAPLPEDALRQAWWAAPPPGGAPSEHSQTWTVAGRVARANILARNVVFERVASR